MVSNGGGGDLPVWAARHLAESDAQAPAPSARPRARHRVGRRPTPRDPSRLRGWALATVAVAAAVGTVPLAVSSLVREDPPMPRVGTFPVVAPGDLGSGEDGFAEARTGRDTASATDPVLAGVLPPVVTPTAATRPLPAAAAPRRASASARGPARGGAAPTASLTPTTTSAPASSTTSPDATEPRVDTGENTGQDTEEIGTVTPREGTSTTPTTTTTTRPPSRRPPERDGLLPDLVRGVGDTAGGLLR